ncbi:6-bladed beta-propeller [Parabacteroides bouchesdurhonensis]|uniref:6-bladed beta-propeller n=1 Tax=Parabacteroides bouchesdurhonensis TaxID=1936995 RepID=UPI00164D2EF2|nr:6-bladed beta-propeller [Parabacteroides bouchesdurhonensis]
MKFIILFISIIALSSCSNKRDNSKVTNKLSIESDSTLLKNDTDISINIRPLNKQIPIYDKITKFDNYLSTIASEIYFVKLDDEPLIRDFFIYDIQKSEDYIFLQGPDYIYQYNSLGKYIKTIGSKGQGPGEYINLNPSIQLDSENKLLYACDSKLQRCLIYDFDGIFRKSIKIGKNQGYIALLDSHTIAVKTAFEDRFLPNNSLSLLLLDREWKTTKAFKSSLYPVSREGVEQLGPEVNPLWKCHNDFYMLEYGNDTIYQIINRSIVPVLILTGELKLKKNELFKSKQGNKVTIAGPLMKPNSYIYESDHFLIFRIHTTEDVYFAVYNKQTGTIYRTGKHEKTYQSEYKSNKNKDFFIDDLVSGMAIDPLYQSEDKAIGIISAASIIDDKDNILNYISAHPSLKGEQLKQIIENIDEGSNSVLCFIRLK